MSYFRVSCSLWSRIVLWVIQKPISIQANWSRWARATTCATDAGCVKYLSKLNLFRAGNSSFWLKSILDNHLISIRCPAYYLYPEEKTEMKRSSFSPCTCPQWTSRLSNWQFPTLLAQYSCSVYRLEPSCWLPRPDRPSEYSCSTQAFCRGQSHRPRAKKIIRL